MAQRGAAGGATQSRVSRSRLRLVSSAMTTSDAGIFALTHNIVSPVPWAGTSVTQGQCARSTVAAWSNSNGASARSSRQPSKLLHDVGTSTHPFRLLVDREEVSMSAGDWKNLYQASVDGNLSLVQHHINEGVNPNYQHPEVLRTPLVASLIEGHLDVALYLLEHGADPSLVSDFDQLSPLQAAGRHGHQDFAMLLRQRGASVPKAPFWQRWLRT